LSSLFRNPKGTSTTITARFRPRQKQLDHSMMTRINIGLAALLMLMGMVVTRADECPITTEICKDIPATCIAATPCPEMPFWIQGPSTTGRVLSKVCVSITQPEGGIVCNIGQPTAVNNPVTLPCPSNIYAFVVFSDGLKAAFRGAGDPLSGTPVGTGFVPPAGATPTPCDRPQGARNGFCAPTGTVGVPTIETPPGAQWSIKIGTFECWLRIGTRGQPVNNLPTGSAALNSISCSPAPL